MNEGTPTLQIQAIKIFVPDTQLKTDCTSLALIARDALHYPIVAKFLGEPLMSNPVQIAYESLHWR